MKYFILKPKSKHFDDTYAQASRAAMRTFARYIQKANPGLHGELWEWANAEQMNESAMKNSTT